jgi:hypothetical protein
LALADPFGPSVFRLGRHTDAGIGWPDMCVSACAMIACARIRSDWTDMRSSIDAAIVNSRATAGN